MPQLTIIFDLETSGFRGLPLFSEFNRIVQICAVDCNNENRIFNSFVNPGGQIPPFSSQIHGIYDNDVVEALTITSVLEDFENFFEIFKYESVELIAHNATWFDEPILRKEYYRAKRVFPNNITFFDTLPFFRKQYPGIEKYSLNHLHKHFFGKDIENAHRADADVGALMKLYHYFVRDKRKKPLYLTCTNCLTELYYIGPERAYIIIRSLKCETVNEIKQFWVTKACKVDHYIQNVLKVNDITQRMIIASQFLDLNVTSPELKKHLTLTVKDDQCLNETDYYIKFKYYNKSRLTKLNKLTFQKGLLRLKQYYL